MKRIATLTMNPALDMSTETDELVANQKLRCSRPRYEPGGGGINASRAIALLGGTSVAVYTAGGQTGRALRQLLDAEGVEAAPIEIAGTTNESFHVAERSTGDQFRFTMPGPHLSEQEWRACLDEVAGLAPEPEIVVASGSLPPGAPDDFHTRLASTVNDRGGRLVVDTSGEALQHAIQAGVFLVKPNIRELGQACGRELRTSGEAEDAARSLIAGTPTQTIVVSLGAEGAMLVTADGSERFPTPSTEVRSRIGAGDSMVGGTALALARGEDLVEAVRFGVAAGVAAVMTPGTELCRREDTERLYREMREAATSR